MSSSSFLDKLLSELKELSKQLKHFSRNPDGKQGQGEKAPCVNKMAKARSLHKSNHYIK